MTLDAIYKEYCDNHSDEIEHKLCERIKKLAGIVLKQFRIRPYDDDYEEFMQEGYLLFFELLPTYDPSVGRLDGYFIVSFQLKLATFLRKRANERRETLPLDEALVPDAQDLATEYLYDDLIAKFNMTLDDKQRDIFSLRLEGYTSEEIAEMMDVTEVDAKVAVELIKDQFEKFIKD